jgi:uncharacterized membrane protein YcaP (DUF421 family)
MDPQHPTLIAEIFSHPDLHGGLVIAEKTAVIYLFLVLGLRLLGKRELGQMNLYDLVLIVVLANAVQNAMVGDDTTLVGGLIAASILLVMNRGFAILMARSKRVERAMVGGPILIVSNGKPLLDRMRREGITRDQLLAALREHGLQSPDKARLCVLEVDGTISVVPNSSETFRTRRHFKALRLP